MRISSMKGRLLTLSAILFLLMFQTVNQASAAQIIIVDSRGDGVRDDGNCTLREAVQAANTNRAVDGCAAGGNPTDIIQFADTIAVRGIVLGSELRVTERLAIEGPSPRYQPITTNRSGRIFSAESATRLSLSNINLHTGYTGENGALIQATNTDIAVRHSILSNGIADGNGGAISVTNGRLIVVATQVRNNTAAGTGGALDVSGNVDIYSSNFFNNKSVDGAGGVLNIKNGDLFMSRTDVRNNSSDAGGGGAIAGTGSKLTIRTSLFSGNHAYPSIREMQTDGGAILSNGGPVVISDSEFLENGTNSLGGAISLRGSYINVTDATFHGNSSDGGGGAVSIINSSMEFRDTFFYNNSSFGDGGGVLMKDASGRFTGGFFTSNESAKNGGAANLERSTVNFNAVRFLSNEARIRGGAMYLANGLSTVDGGYMRSSSAGTTGGAIHAQTATINLNNVEIRNSDAVQGGGGIHVAQGATLRLYDGDVISNIANANGGGIHVVDSSYEISFSRINNNKSKHPIGKSEIGDGLGGGIYLNRARGTISSSSVTANTAVGGGGGIALVDSRLDGTSLFVGDNRAFNSGGVTFGGGIYMERSSGTLHTISINRNQAWREGGGVALIDNSTLAIAGGQAIGNVVFDGFGGGFSARESKLRFGDYTIEGNRAAVSQNTPGLVRWGGGIASLNSQTILGHVTVRWNSADQGGGIMSKAGSGQSPQISPSLSILFSTINGNGATGVGGGISAESTPANISNSTISGNYAPSAAGIHANNSYIDVRHATITANGSEGIFSEFGTIFLRNSIVANNGGVNCSGQVNGTAYNLSSDNSCAGSLVGNPLLGGLADNGGRTPTHALLKGSPAIDAAEESICNAHPITRFDQRLNKRIGSCDLGAFEFPG